MKADFFITYHHNDELAARWIADILLKCSPGCTGKIFLKDWNGRILNNPDFKLVEFDQFRNEAGSNYFVLSPKKWIDSTNAIGITSKSGKYGCIIYYYNEREGVNNE